MRTEPTPEGRERGKHPAPGSLPLTGQDRGASEPQGEAQQLDWGEGEAEREPHRPRLPPGHHSPRRLQGGRGRDSGSEEAGSRERTGVAAQRPPGGSGEAAHSRGSMGGGLGPWETPGATAGESLGGGRDHHGNTLLRRHEGSRGSGANHHSHPGL